MIPVSTLPSLSLSVCVCMSLSLSLSLSLYMYVCVCARRRIVNGPDVDPSVLDTRDLSL